MVDISFIIVNWNTRDILIDCINSVYNTVKDIDLEIYVVDNASTDGSQDAVKNKFPDIKLIENKSNTGFAHANNQAIKHMHGKYAVLLNTDTLLQKNAIKTLLAFMDNHPKAGIAGVQLLNNDGSKQNSIDNLPSLETEIFNKSLLRLIFPKKYPGKRTYYDSPIEVDSVIGACMMVRKEAIGAVGGLDEDYFFFLEETDWCHRMKEKGWSVFHVPESMVIHFSGHSKRAAPWESQIEYYRSLYKYFRKNKGEGAYILLRISKPLKVLFNLILNCFGCTLTLFQVKSINNKFLKYYKLLIWHLLLCPDNMGIKKK